MKKVNNMIKMVVLLVLICGGYVGNAGAADMGSQAAAELLKTLAQKIADFTVEYHNSKNNLVKTIDQINLKRDLNIQLVYAAGDELARQGQQGKLKRTKFGENSLPAKYEGFGCVYKYTVDKKEKSFLLKKIYPFETHFKPAIRDGA